MVITYFILTMNLTESFRHLRLIEPNVNHRETLVKRLILAQKIANTQERISYLIQCRKANVIPRFIQQIVRKTDQISSRSLPFQAQKKRFCREMLNEAIRESHRKQAYLAREKHRLYQNQDTSSPDVMRWVSQEASRIFWTQLEERRRILVKKFRGLVSGRQGHPQPPNADDFARPEETAGEPEDGTETPDTLPTPARQDGNIPCAAQDAQMQTEADQSPVSRLKNLSDVPLASDLAQLLSNGPKYALARRVTASVIKDAECGIERGNYALRWKVDIESRRSQVQTTECPHSPGRPYLI